MSVYRYDFPEVRLIEIHLNSCVSLTLLHAIIYSRSSMQKECLFSVGI